MIIKGSDLLGLEVKSKNNLALGYTVDDLVIASKGNYVIALLLKNNYLKKESKKNCKILCFNKIIEINNSIVTLNEKSITTFEQRPEIYELVEKPIKMIGFEVYSNNQELIGVVKDTILNINNGRIMGLVLSEGLFTDLYNGYSVLPLDSNLTKYNYDCNKVIINELNQEQIFNYGGGFKNIFSIDSDN